MDLNWIFYAVVMFIAGGTCFFTAIAALVKLDQVEPQMATDPLITQEAPSGTRPETDETGSTGPGNSSRLTSLSFEIDKYTRSPFRSPTKGALNFSLDS